MSRKIVCMKKTAILLLISVLFVFRTVAQTSFEFIPTGGYTFQDRVNFFNNYGRINEGLNWGGSLLFNINHHVGIELMFNRMDTKGGLYPYGSETPLNQQDVGINYIMAGPVSSIYIPGSAVHPFFGLLLGAAVFNPGPSDFTSNTKFAVGAELGTNIYVSPRFGIRLKAQLLSPVEGANGGYYFGSFGNGAGVSTYSDIYQFGLNAGLIIGLGRVLPKPKPRVYIHRPPPGPRYYYRYSPYPPPPPPYYH
jgi:hypothetical protein